jgi:glycine cleavage system H protein
MSNQYPDDLRYTKEHEWARVEGDTAVVGITQFAIESLGDITNVELPSEGETFRAGDVVATVESVKAVSDIFAPLSGKIIAVNDPLRDSPEDLDSEHCYDEGWLYRVQFTKKDELNELMTSAQYHQYVKEQG